MAPIRFVILAAPRTGSNLLCSLLQSHPDILCHHEIFNPADVYYALPLRDSAFSLGSLEQRERDSLAYMTKIWANDLGHKAVGFKMTHRQNPAVLSALCEDPGIQKIVLKRRARIRTYVSRLIAEKTGVWEAYGASPDYRPVTRVAVDYQALLDDIAYNAAYYSELDRRLKGRRVTVFYEDLFDADCQRTMLNFIGLPAIALRSESHRQNPQALHDIISNHSALARRLNVTCQDRDLYAELTGHDHQSVQFNLDRSGFITFT